MLTNLHEQVAEAHGLAISASSVTARVERHVPRGALRRRLRTMRAEADETRARCLEVERSYGAELADELRARAIATDARGADLVDAWFKAATEPLAAWTFLTMAESAEAAAWRAVATLAARAGPEAEPVRALAAWALPVHDGHLRLALDHASLLAAMLGPGAPREG
jgi:hypothetical protein